MNPTGYHDRFYAGFDDLPPEAREVFAQSRWLGMLQEWQIRQIPRGPDIVSRLRRADQVMSCGNNVVACFTEPMMERLTQILFHRG